eukprot:116333-Prorocentrum_minimum.AAC.4
MAVYAMASSPLRPLAESFLRPSPHFTFSRYGSGSGQQSVTCYEGGDDANSYWVSQPHVLFSIGKTSLCRNIND